MPVSLSPSQIKDWVGSVLVIGVLEGNIETQLTDLQATLETDFLFKTLAQQNFQGKAGEVITLNVMRENPKKVILIGLGSPEQLGIENMRQAAASGARSCLGISGKLGVLLPWEPFDPATITKVVAEAIRLSTFKDLRFKYKPEPIEFPKEIELLGLPNNADNLLQEINPICSGVELARELVGAPPNSLTPSELANQALNIAKEFNLESKILNREECHDRKMGSYLAVSQGSDLEPKFIHLTYKPQGKSKKRLVMIGKGLTFDSGGYNLKVGASQIEKMKYDMGGSAAVIGAARAIAELRPKDVEVHFIVAACENMINGSALHPGDIITASNGKTIEVNNTDAEGRLTLADALVYGCELEPDAIIDLATLTGACVIALGDEIAGLWTDNDQLAKQITISANSVGEGMWRMPMQNSYKKGLKSMLADLQNTGPRAGGSITAALFLKEFVQESIPWAHIDIAGTCWTDKDRGVDPAGPTGYGVRTLVEWACNGVKSGKEL